MSKSNIYRDIFTNILREDSTAGDGGAFGTAAPTGNDVPYKISYADGDNRNITGSKLGRIQRRGLIKPLKKKNKKKSGV